MDDFRERLRRMQPKRFYSTEKLAKALDLTQDAVRAMGERGELPAPIKLGRLYRWPADEIDAHLEALKKKG